MEILVCMSSELRSQTSRREFQTPAPKPKKMNAKGNERKDMLMMHHLGDIPHLDDQHFDRIEDAQKIGPLICPTTQRLLNNSDLETAKQNSNL